MIFLISLSFFTLGLYLGLRLQKIFSQHLENNERKKLIEKVNNVYLNLLSQMMSGNVKFKSRINQICYLVSEIENEGVVEVVYMIDRKDVAIFKDGKCIYTSDIANKEIISNISEFIESTFRSEIMDVVNVLGLVMSKIEFEKTFKIKFEDFQTLKGKINISDVEDIIADNDIIKFDVDEILDKISAFGIHSLTLEERLFLDNYSNEKGN
jgi:hypothetical protein